MLREGSGGADAEHADGARCMQVPLPVAYQASNPLFYHNYYCLIDSSFILSSYHFMYISRGIWAYIKLSM